MHLTIDCETRCTEKIKEVGAYRYCEDITFEILCCVAMVDEGPCRLYAPGYGDLTREELTHLMRKADTIEAHNSNFERLAFARWGVDLPLSKWRCSAAKAAAAGLPRSLEGAGTALNLGIQKGDNTAMRKCCIGRKGVFSNDLNDLAALHSYCRQDVLTEYALSNALPDLSSREQKIWALDQRINDRGILIDAPACEAIRSVLAAEEERLTDRLQYLTGGAVTSGKQPLALAEWLGSKSASKDALKALKPANATEAEVLSIRKQLALSSVAKIDKMLGCACHDGRVRGTLLYHGAATGRWAGRLIQPQNLPRTKFKEAEMEAAIQVFLRGDVEEVRFLYGDPFACASQLIRGLLIPGRGNRFISSDYTAVEAKMIAWLAGEERVLAAFRAGKDIYVSAAAGIYGDAENEITDQQRQIGKVAILACGYQGGYRAFQKMGKNYGVTVPEQEAKNIVASWRQANRNIVRFWYSLDKAAIAAVKSLAPQKVGNLTLSMRGDWLQVSLPNGRPINYYKPEVHFDEKFQRDALTCMRENSLSHKFERQSLYGGLLAENVTQGACRDIMAGAMLRLEEAGYPVVFTVHDEVVAEVPEGRGAQEEFDEIMSQIPRWASGMPLTAKGWSGHRYRKD